jgi:hypothetical protein
MLSYYTPSYIQVQEVHNIQPVPDWIRQLKPGETFCAIPMHHTGEAQVVYPSDLVPCRHTLEHPRRV